MKIIEKFTSDDIEPGDTTISEYVYDSDGNPVFKSIVLLKGGPLHQTGHVTPLGFDPRKTCRRPQVFPLPSIDPAPRDNSNAMVDQVAEL
jgi:hypothetical protein